jgi:pyruvate/2-oxoglutarate dehydrogenase complex dihydrolipoamide dehydrogenase (E3) component
VLTPQGDPEGDLGKKETSVARQDYDAIVIGAGQGGVPLATALAKAGRNTALVEREHVGGTCINEGCTPTKTMVASAKVAYFDRRSADYGVSNGQVAVDMIRVRQRKRDIVDSFRSGGEKRLRDAGVDLIMGEARFTGPKDLEVQLNDGGETLHLSADSIFINTGARPANPPIEGLDGVLALNSTSIMELDEVPEHLLVLGGSYVGLEFAQMFRRFGSEVTVVQRGKQLMSREDPDVAEAVVGIMREDGIEVLLETQTRRVEHDNAIIRLRVSTPEGERSLEGSHLLVAAGRPPNTDTLNLEAAGIEIDQRGQIKVNERLETTAPGVWALGDVKGGPAFTHISYDDFRILRTNLLEGGDATITGRKVPYTVFIDPQLGRAGLSEQEARQRGLNIRVAKIPMSYVARAIEVDEARGFMKAIVDADTDQILGCAILGIEGGEIAAMLQIAMMGEVPYTTLRDTVFSHPTLSESLNTLFAAIEQEDEIQMTSQAEMAMES